jgi:ankyrin repeat protein
MYDMLTVQRPAQQSGDGKPSSMLQCRKRKQTVISQTSIDEENQQQRKSISVTSLKVNSPYQFVCDTYIANGLSIRKSKADFSPLFPKPTEAQIAAYCLDTVKAAVRNTDINELRRLHAAGVSFDCCNRYGESLISMVCRRGNAEIAKFLVKEANVSLFICDDFGRTVLHDACWTVEPAFELMELLLEEVPDFIFVRDVRGHTPFDYLRKEHWQEWTSFLQDRKHLLHPKLLL